jgi:predicted solute-binding protein
VVTPAGVGRLRAALDAGRAAFPEIAAAHANGTPGRAAAYESYLRENVVYELGEEEIAGLREFYHRAHALGLVPAPPELSFHADQ